MQNKGQGAIEYLLIIGAAILVIAVVIIAVSGVLSSSRDDANSSQGDYSNALEVLRDQGINESSNANQVAYLMGLTVTQPTLLASIFPDAPVGSLVILSTGQQYSVPSAEWDSASFSTPQKITFIAPKGYVPEAVGVDSNSSSGFTNDKTGPEIYPSFTVCSGPNEDMNGFYAIGVLSQVIDSSSLKVCTIESDQVNEQIIATKHFSANVTNLFWNDDGGVHYIMPSNPNQLQITATISCSDIFDNKTTKPIVFYCDTFVDENQSVWEVSALNGVAPFALDSMGNCLSSNCSLDWGDGNIDLIKTLDWNLQHTYYSAGNFYVKLNDPNNSVAPEKFLVTVVDGNLINDYDGPQILLGEASCNGDVNESYVLNIDANIIDESQLDSCTLNSTVFGGVIAEKQFSQGVTNEYWGINFMSSVISSDLNDVGSLIICKDKFGNQSIKQITFNCKMNDINLINDYMGPEILLSGISCIKGGGGESSYFFGVDVNLFDESQLDLCVLDSNIFGGVIAQKQFSEGITSGYWDVRVITPIVDFNWNDIGALINCKDIFDNQSITEIIFNCEN